MPVLERPPPRATNMRQRTIRSMIGLLLAVAIMEHFFAGHSLVNHSLAAPAFAAAAEHPRADKIIILKSAHTMTLLSAGKVMKTYKVALGTEPVGPKRIEGDHKT